MAVLNRRYVSQYSKKENNSLQIYGTKDHAYRASESPVGAVLVGCGPNWQQLICPATILMPGEFFRKVPRSHLRLLVSFHPDFST